jgi:hypothetical protein
MRYEQIIIEDIIFYNCLVYWFWNTEVTLLPFTSRSVIFSFYLLLIYPVEIAIALCGKTKLSSIFQNFYLALAILSAR